MCKLRLKKKDINSLMFITFDATTFFTLLDFIYSQHKDINIILTRYTQIINNMPYRRLPNTDQARFRALKTAIEMSNKLDSKTVAISQITSRKAKQFFPLFQQALLGSKSAFSNQVEKSKKYVELQRKAKLYISHFIQVLNFAIARGEMPEKALEFYGLNLSNCKASILKTDDDIVEWGKKLVEGDMKRMAAGGNYMTNPKIADVKVRYEIFAEARWKQKSLQTVNSKSIERIANLRAEADSIILNIWNDVEAHFINYSDDERRDKCREYGISYVYRKHEKERMSVEKLATNNEILSENNFANNRINILQNKINQKLNNNFARPVYEEANEASY